MKHIAAQNSTSEALLVIEYLSAFDSRSRAVRESDTNDAKAAYWPRWDRKRLGDRVIRRRMR